MIPFKYRSSSLVSTVRDNVLTTASTCREGSLAREYLEWYSRGSNERRPWMATLNEVKSIFYSLLGVMKLSTLYTVFCIKRGFMCYILSNHYTALLSWIAKGDVYKQYFTIFELMKWYIQNSSNLSKVRSWCVIYHPNIIFTKLGSDNIISFETSKWSQNVQPKVTTLVRPILVHFS